MRGSEPRFFVGDVSIHKILVCLGEIDDALDKSDDAGNSASYEGSDELNDPLFGVAKIEFMDAETAEQNPKQAGD